jgi:F-type H+-transporting ATPase subunit delta
MRAALADAVAAVATPALERVLGHPAVPAERKRAVLAAVLDRPADHLAVRLAALLSERRRLALLPQIERSYVEQWNRRRGAVTAEVATASALAPAQEEALASALRRLGGRAVEVRGEVRPDLLGGVVVRMEGRVFDGSVRGRLRALRAALAERA